MLNRFTVTICVIFLFMAFFSKANAENKPSTAKFLTFPVDARSAAFAGAYTSTAENASAAYWNPAGLAYVNSPQFICSHIDWYQDLKFEYISGAVPINDAITLSLSATYMSYGKINGYDSNDNFTEKIESTFDFAGGVSLGLALSDNLSVGITGKQVIVSLAGIRASTTAFDLGLRLRLQNYRFGITVSNIGRDMVFIKNKNSLPTIIRGGLTIVPFGLPIMYSSEIEYPMISGQAKFRNGAEFTFQENYFLRVGHCFEKLKNSSTGIGAYSLGAGIRFGVSQFDYAFSPESAYLSENLHHFTVQFGF